MVHADAIVSEISCQQKFFLVTFLVKLNFSCYSGISIKFEVGGW